MEKFVIRGNRPLNGEVTPSGNKNSALPLLAATILTDKPVVLHNVPDIQDVRTMCSLLSELGVDICYEGAHTLRCHARDVKKADLASGLCQAIRASILLAGPMLARCGEVELPPPGGDVIGRRRVDTHILALKALGAEIDIDDKFIMRADRLRGTDMLLDEASVTGTENTIMAAVLAKGKTVIRNAASEPHVQELCHFLNSLGADITGIGSNTLTIRGVDGLAGGEFGIGPDYLEVGSFIGLAAITGGEIRIENVVPGHLRMILLVYDRLGVRPLLDVDELLVKAGQPLEIVSDIGDVIPKIDDAPWPAFPADMMSVALVVATQARGTVLFHEKMFESRLYFVDRLIEMGARIVLCDPHRCVVQGPSSLHGVNLVSPDIRAGMALLLASLCADGTSEMHNIGQIDRGYERIEEKLQALGADIERVSL